MTQTLILIAVGFSAGFVDAVAGGGGLISLPSLLALGVPPKLALGTNKAIGICTSSASSFRYWRAGASDRKRILPLAIFAGALGAVGAYVATQLRPEVLRPIILIGLILVGLYVLTQRRFGLSPSKKPKSVFLLFPLVAAIGFYDGFFGPGTGTFLMTAFVLLAGQPLLNAAANSRMVNFATNLGAILLFASLGYVDFRFALPASLSAFVGGLCGAQWAIKKGSKAIRSVFLVVTWVLIAKVAWDLLKNWS